MRARFTQIAAAASAKEIIAKDRRLVGLSSQGRLTLLSSPPVGGSVGCAEISGSVDFVEVASAVPRRMLQGVSINTNS